MDETLGYLRESLSNYLETSPPCIALYKKLLHNHYEDELAFVRDLDVEEINLLNTVLQKELEYARDTQDDKRAGELTEIFELLF
jgi:hypothetical protein